MVTSGIDTLEPQNMQPDTEPQNVFWTGTSLLDENDASGEEDGQYGDEHSVHSYDSQDQSGSSSEDEQGGSSSEEESTPSDDDELTQAVGNIFEQ